MSSSSTESLSAGVRHSLTLRYTLSLVAEAAKHLEHYGQVSDLDAAHSLLARLEQAWVSIKISLEAERDNPSSNTFLEAQPGARREREEISI